jgi:predicted nucleic acid-binding protein
VPRYLADTSAWHRSSEPEVAERWAALLEFDEIALCAPVELEILFSARSKADYAIRQSELRGLALYPVVERNARRAVDTQASLAERSQHRGPTPVDLLVAAIAERADLTLLHYDRHFDAIARVTGQPMEWLARRGSLR